MLRSKENAPPPEVFQTDELPDKLRTQILWLMKNYIGENPMYFGAIRDYVCQEHGLPCLAKIGDPGGDVATCILKSPDVNLVVDLLQVICQELSGPRTPYYARPGIFISELNRFFRENGVGFEYNTGSKKLLPLGNVLIQQNAVQPAISLLSKKAFATANSEYITAFEHFKKGPSEYGDCLTECCKALESTLKIIADKRGWPIDPKATFQPLLKVYLQETGQENYWEQPLVVLATLRNRKDAHGGGATPHVVHKHEAQYALHATGSAILFLVEGAGL